MVMAINEYTESDQFEIMGKITISNRCGMVGWDIPPTPCLSARFTSKSRLRKLQLKAHSNSALLARIGVAAVRRSRYPVIQQSDINKEVLGIYIASSDVSEMSTFSISF
jgi:hypothetical protein